MKKNFLIITACFLTLLGCQPPTPKQEKQPLATYHNSDIGWTITIPEGFSVLSKNRMEAKEARGRAAIGADSSKTASADGLQNLVNFQKNQFNLFSATLQKFQGTQPSYLKNQQVLKKLIFDAYAKQKIKIDTSSGKSDFAGRSFQAFYLKIYGPDGSLLMNQELYSSLINGYDLSVNMNYNNELDHEILLHAFKNSTFVKPKN